MKYSSILLSVLVLSLLANARPSSTPVVGDTSSPSSRDGTYPTLLWTPPLAKLRISDYLLEHGLVRSKRSHPPPADAPRAAKTAKYASKGVNGNVTHDKTAVHDFHVDGNSNAPNKPDLQHDSVHQPEKDSSSDGHGPRKRRAMEAVAKRFHAHNRHPRSRVFSKRDAPTDIDILNFALAMEHLDAAFYKYGLQKYSMKEFRHAGYPRWIRRRYEQLAKNKRTHVEFLQSALGDRAVKSCAYSFKEEDIEQWVIISFVIETVGTSAWNGLVANLDNREYRTVAASIMGVNARHAAWINSVVRKENAWNTPFETPLDMNQVYTILSPYIVPGSCPSTNAPLRVTPFPALHVPPSSPGSIITLEFDSSAAKEAEKQKQQLFAAFVSGTGTVFVSLREGKKVEIPKGLVGVIYVYVTRDGGKVGNEGIVAGPGVVWFEFRA